MCWELSENQGSQRSGPRVRGWVLRGCRGGKARCSRVLLCKAANVEAMEGAVRYGFRISPREWPAG